MRATVSHATTQRSAAVCTAGGCNAPEAECSGACMVQAAAAASPLHTFVVTVGRGPEATTYTALFANSCDASTDAIERWSHLQTRIHVAKKETP